MDYRTQRQFYRAQRRTYRRRTRGPVGGLIALIVVLSIVSNHLFWVLLPFLIALFIFQALRPRFSGMSGPTNQQQYSQPTRQDQPIYTYQPPTQQDPPPYSAYTQGYGSQPSNQPARIYREQDQQDQYFEQQQHAQQYEDPLTMYPQE